MGHVTRHLARPERWVVLMARAQPKRLIVFVHGFGGSAVGTWKDLHRIAFDDEWWSESDLLFVGYPSLRSNIAGTATVLRKELDTFYPQLPDDLLVVKGERVRPPDTQPYQELLLIGHSLGGVVLRAAMLEAVQAQRDGAQRGHAILHGQLRLFSPAIAGFQPSGWLGLVRATTVWPFANVFLRSSATYTELQPGSAVLTKTRGETETLIHPDAPHRDSRLRARILWANPDEVVSALSYTGDFANEQVQGRSHVKMCKTADDYRTPLTFIKTGET